MPAPPAQPRPAASTAAPRAPAFVPTTSIRSTLLNRLVTKELDGLRAARAAAEVERKQALLTKQGGAAGDLAGGAVVPDALLSDAGPASGGALPLALTKEAQQLRTIRVVEAQLRQRTRRAEASVAIARSLAQRVDVDERSLEPVRRPAPPSGARGTVAGGAGSVAFGSLSGPGGRLSPRATAVGAARGVSFAANAGARMTIASSGSLSAGGRSPPHGSVSPRGASVAFLARGDSRASTGTNSAASPGAWDLQEAPRRAGRARGGRSQRKSKKRLRYEELKRELEDRRRQRRVARQQRILQEALDANTPMSLSISARLTRTGDIIDPRRAQQGGGAGANGPMDAGDGGGDDDDDADDENDPLVQLLRKLEEADDDIPSDYSVSDDGEAFSTDSSSEEEDDEALMGSALAASSAARQFAIAGGSSQTPTREADVHEAALAMLRAVKPKKADVDAKREEIREIRRAIKKHTRGIGLDENGEVVVSKLDAVLGAGKAEMLQAKAFLAGIERQRELTGGPGGGEAPVAGDGAGGGPAAGDGNPLGGGAEAGGAAPTAAPSAGFMALAEREYEPPEVILRLHYDSQAQRLYRNRDRTGASDELPMPPPFDALSISIIAESLARDACETIVATEGLLRVVGECQKRRRRAASLDSDYERASRAVIRACLWSTEGLRQVERFCRAQHSIAKGAEMEVAQKRRDMVITSDDVDTTGRAVGRQAQAVEQTARAVDDARKELAIKGALVAEDASQQLLGDDKRAMLAYSRLRQLLSRWNVMAGGGHRGGQQPAQQQTPPPQAPPQAQTLAQADTNAQPQQPPPGEAPPPESSPMGSLGSLISRVKAASEQEKALARKLSGLQGAPPAEKGAAPAPGAQAKGGKRSVDVALEVLLLELVSRQTITSLRRECMAATGMIAGGSSLNLLPPASPRRSSGWETSRGSVVAESLTQAGSDDSDP